MAVEANLGSGSTEMVIGVVILVVNTIEIIEELVVFIGYKVSKLKVFKVAIAIARRVRRVLRLLGSNNSC